MSNLPAVRESDAFELGKVFAASGMFPNVRKEAEAIVKIVAGQEFGLGPLAAMNGIHMVDGKPTLAANLIAGQIKRHPLYNYKVLRREDDGCELEFFERDSPVAAYVSQGTMKWEKKDATAAGLSGKQNWKKYPRDMYFARCLTAGARTFCPDVLGGSPIYTAEELGAEDVEAPVHSGVVASTVPVENVKATGAGQPDEPEVADAEVVEDKPTVETVKAELSRSLVDTPTLDQLRDMSAKAWPDTAKRAEKLKWTLVSIGVENVEDLKAAMAGLTLDQAIQVFELIEKELGGDDGVPGSGATS